MCFFSCLLLLIRYVWSFVYDVFRLIFFSVAFFIPFSLPHSLTRSLLLSYSIVYFVWSYQELHQYIQFECIVLWTLCVPVYTLYVHSNSEIYVINHKIHWLFQTIDITWYSDTFNSIFLLSFLFRFRFYSFIRCLCQFFDNWTE